MLNHIHNVPSIVYINKRNPLDTYGTLAATRITKCAVFAGVKQARIVIWTKRL